MKNKLTFGKAILASVIAATALISCEPKSNPSVLPEFKGEITLDRTRIGQGQKLTASYVIPTGGSNIEEGSIRWHCDNAQIVKGAQTTEKDGVSTIKFIADYKPGDHTIEFIRQYLNFDKAESQVRSMTKSFKTEKCDVLTSFWGDSKEVVMATANEKFEDNKDVLSAFAKDFTSHDEIHQYFFDKDKLNKILITSLVDAYAGKAVGYVNARATIIELDGYKRLSYDYVDVVTGVKTTVDLDRLKDASYTNPISADVENGKLELLVVLENAKNTLSLSYKMADVGVVLNTTTYVPR